MKMFTVKMNQWLFPLLLVLFLVAGCTTEEAEPDTDEQEENLDEEQPGETPGISIQEILDHLKFENATLKDGNIPQGSPLADLKIDRETIYLADGLEILINLLIPESYEGDVSGVYVQIPGAEKYFEEKFVSKEKLIIDDSLFRFKIRLLAGMNENIENFKMIIAPFDEQGRVIDRFEKNTVRSIGNQCTPTLPFGRWEWVYTKLGDDLEYAPGFTSNLITTKTNGCCVNGKTVDCISSFIPESEWVSLDYTSFVQYTGEILEFKDNGTFNSTLYDHKQNLDYSESNFCANEAAYVVRKNENLANGNYTFNEANRTIRLSNIETRERQVYLELLDMTVPEWDFTFLRAEATLQMVGCQYIVEKSRFEGMERVRVFERKSADHQDWVD